MSGSAAKAVLLTGIEGVSRLVRRIVLLRMAWRSAHALLR